MAWVIDRTGYPGVVGVVGGAGGAHYLDVVSVPDHYNIYIYVIYIAMNTDSARIRPFFRSLSGRSQCSWSL